MARSSMSVPLEGLGSAFVDLLCARGDVVVATAESSAQAMSTDNTSGEHRWNAPRVAPRVAFAVMHDDLAGLQRDLLSARHSQGRLALEHDLEVDGVGLMEAGDFATHRRLAGLAQVHRLDKRRRGCARIDGEHEEAETPDWRKWRSCLRILTIVGKAR